MEEEREYGIGVLQIPRIRVVVLVRFRFSMKLVICLASTILEGAVIRTLRMM